MTQYRSAFLNELHQRGYIHQCTDFAALDEAASAGTVVAYVGYDATAPSLHVGNLVSIMMLRRLQQTGHRPIVLMGGGTTRIGDPSGKDESRRLLTDAQIAANIASIRSCFERFLEFGDGPTGAIMVNNADWLDGLAYIPLLREIGTHFTINRMLTFDSVRLRLEREHPLTFLEFNYMILQAYDYRELNRRYGCRLQMGGSDQWGNIVNGVELTRRTEGREVFGLTTPLMTTASGAKMGKSVSGAIWLNPEQLPDYDYWQYWRNTEDADVGRFLRIYTDLPLDEVSRYERLAGAEINEAKKVLATEATRLARGDAAAEAAATTARRTFEAGEAAEGLPTVEISPARLAEGLGVLDALRLAGLVASNGEARRLVRQGGVKVNDAAVESDDLTIGTGDVSGGIVKLSVGRKRHALLRISG